MTPEDKYELRGVVIMLCVAAVGVACALLLFGCDARPTDHSVMVPAGYGDLQRAVEEQGKAIAALDAKQATVPALVEIHVQLTKAEKRLTAMEAIDTRHDKQLAEIEKRLDKLEAEELPCPRPPGKLGGKK